MVVTGALAVDHFRKYSDISKSIVSQRKMRISVVLSKELMHESLVILRQCC